MFNVAINGEIPPDLPLSTPTMAIYFSKNWSNKLCCNVGYIEPNNVFMILDQIDKYLKILSSNGETWWILYSTQACQIIEEVNIL
jgi:hypothetical protein